MSNLSCSEGTANKTVVKGQVVLQVADVSITAYELEKNLMRFKEAHYASKSEQPTKDEVEKWIQGFIDRTYFLADAYEKGYSKRNEIFRVVESMEKLMVAQQKGLLAQYLIDKKPPLDTDEIDLARERSKRKISVAYLKFENIDAAADFIGGNQLPNLKEFDNAVERSAGRQDIIYDEDVIRWPFVGFWEYGEYLFSLKKGDLTPILKFQHGAYLLHIKDTEVLDQSTPTDELIQLLDLQKEAEVNLDYQNEVDSDTQIIYNTDLLSKFNLTLAKLVPLHEIDSRYFQEILQENIATFIVGKTETQRSIADFLDYYNYLPIKQEIRNTEQIAHLMRSWLHSEYAYGKAEEWGITKNPEFILDRENYQKSVIYDYYESERLKTLIKISDEEILDWYNINKSKYTKPEGVNVAIFSFDNQQNAGKGVLDIMHRRRDTTLLATLNGLQNIGWDINLGYDKPTLPPNLMHRLLFMKNDQVLPPHELGGNYSVIVKNHDYGQRPISLYEAKEEIIRELEAIKMLEIKQEHLLLLKNKYHCINNISDFE